MLVHLPVGVALLLPFALLAAQRSGRGIKPWWITSRYLDWAGLLGLACAMISGWFWARHLNLIPPGKFLAPHLLNPSAEQWLQVTLWKHQMAAITSVVLGLITPPVAISLSIGALIARVPARVVTREVVPFFIAAVGVLMLVTFVPQLSLWLPNFLHGR